MPAGRRPGEVGDISDAAVPGTERTANAAPDSGTAPINLITLGEK
jgi:hypothetical protein